MKTNIMNPIAIFTVDSNKSIEIVLPDLNDKTNYYYNPSATLHKFDLVTALLKMHEIEVSLCTDTIDEVLMSFTGALKQLLFNRMVLPDNIDIGNLGFMFNVNINNKSFDGVDFSQFWLWSSVTIQSWLYSRGDKFYIEIAPSYPWLYVTPTQEDQEGSYILFDQFMQTYTPLLVTEVDRCLLLKWLHDGKLILKSIEK